MYNKKNSMYEQMIICSKTHLDSAIHEQTIICRKSCAGHVVSSWPPPPRGGGGATPYNGLYGEAPAERGTFFTLQVYERVGSSRVEVYERVGKSVIYIFKRAFH